MLVAALYVDPKGPYPKIYGVDWWDEARDARTYVGCDPVVAHPPCGRWCGMAKMNERRWGAKVGDDGGCFASALAALRRCGGVLEHPAKSLAWGAFGLKPPKGIGWQRAGESEWVGEVWQSAYGHRANKRTWLLYVGRTPPLPFKLERPRGTHQIGGGVHTGNRNKPRLNGPETHLSPFDFANYLVMLARHSLFAPD